MMNFYKNALLGLASNKPLCDSYRDEWRACGEDKKKLLTFSLKQQCIPYVMLYSYKGQGLTKEYLLTEYCNLINGLYVAENSDGVDGYTYELFVDYRGTTTQNSDVVSYMYCEDTDIVIPKCKCPSLFIGCNSDVHISLEGFNSPRIYLYDESKVTIEDADEESDVTIYRYSDKAKVEAGPYCFAKVRVHDKELRTQL